MSTPHTIAASRPYPWPWDGLDPGRVGMVVAGWDTHWRARVVDPDPVEAAILALAELLAVWDAPVHAVCHDRGPRPPEPVVEPHPLPSPASWSPVHAPGLDAAYDTPLTDRLRRAGTGQVLVVGFGLEGPVHSTLRGLNDRGVECLLVTDAAAPGDPSLATAAAHTVTMSGGIFGAVASTAQVTDLFRSVPDRHSTDPREDP